MKRVAKPLLHLITFFLLIISGNVSAQNLELWGFGGYTFRETFEVERGEVQLQDGGTYGGSITYDLNPRYGIEVYYSYQDTDVDVRTFLLTERGIAASVHYIQLGGMRYFPLSDVTVLYAGLNLGAGGLVPKNNYEAGWKFTPGIKFGSKFYLSDRIGIRIQSTLQMPMQFAGTGFFVGTGGAGVSVNSFSTIQQFSFQGGIIIRMN